jgi:hypothetical protein
VASPQDPLGSFSHSSSKYRSLACVEQTCAKPERRRDWDCWNQGNWLSRLG